MTRRDRLRRDLLLCIQCLRNLAYRRAGWHAGRLRLNDRQFWRTVNGNFLDVCVLEWCKVFGSKRDPHCWRNFVSDPSGFKTDLLRHLSLDEAEFRSEERRVGKECR